MRRLRLQFLVGLALIVGAPRGVSANERPRALGAAPLARVANVTPSNPATRTHRTEHATARRRARDVDTRALAPIVGEWQSDTVGGVSARSSCIWTPRKGGVLCEQRLTMPDGERTALDLFTTDSASGTYHLYVVQRSGDTVNPVLFTIEGSRWTYGGGAAAGDGRFYRTVNEFAKPNEYTWRQESSSDGKSWSVGIHGRNWRVR